MGKMTNVLNEIQESRRYHQEQKTSDSFYFKDGLTYSKKVIMVIVAIIATGTIAIVYMSNKIYNLEKSEYTQEKRFNDLTAFLFNTKNFSDSQIQYFNFRLKDEADIRKMEINNLALVDNVYYIKIMKGILANTRQIGYLNNYANYLKGKIEKNSASNSQVKDLSIPPMSIK